MKIEKYVPKGREILSFIIDTAIYEMKQEKGTARNQFLISSNSFTISLIKEEISNKHCIACSENSFVVDWKEGKKSFAISISFNEEVCCEENVIKIYYILIDGTQVYKYASHDPEKVLIFKFKV